VPVVFPLTSSKQERQQEFREVRDTLLELEGNPLALEQRIYEMTFPLQEMDPDVGMMVAQNLSNAQTYLAMHLPRVHQNPLNPDEEILPAQSEMDGFIRKVRVLDDPWSLLELTASGRITLDEIDAVRAVFPDIYAETTNDAIEVAAETRGKMPYQIKVHLSTLFDLDLDSSMNPGFLLAMSNQGAQTAEQNQAVSGGSSHRSTRQPASVNMSFSFNESLNK
jgi:hypothetical protein